MHHELVVTGIYSQNSSMFQVVYSEYARALTFQNLRQGSRLSSSAPFNARQSRLHLSFSAQRELDTTARALAKSMQSSRFLLPAFPITHHRRYLATTPTVSIGLACFCCTSFSLLSLIRRSPRAMRGKTPCSISMSSHPRLALFQTKSGFLCFFNIDDKS